MKIYPFCAYFESNLWKNVQSPRQVGPLLHTLLCTLFSEMAPFATMEALSQNEEKEKGWRDDDSTPVQKLSAACLGDLDETGGAGLYTTRSSLDVSYGH